MTRTLVEFTDAASNGKLAKGLEDTGRALGYDGRYIVFNIPAGWSCPAAHACASRADRETGKITDGTHTQFRCYAATLEARPSLRAKLWRNYDALRACGTDVDALTALLLESLERYGLWRDGAHVIRIHGHGDFYNRAYLQAWLNVARAYPNALLYAYTKALPYVLECRAAGLIPDNMRFIASRGGRYDHLIATSGLPESVVVFSEAEAAALGLPIDDDDTHAAFGDGSFALVIHGTQPKGTDASAALKVINANKRALKLELVN